jgi:hypothetical protein
MTMTTDGYTTSEQAKIDAAEILAQHSDIATAMRRALSRAESIPARRRAEYTREVIARISKRFDERLDRLTELHVASFARRL